MANGADVPGTGLRERKAQRLRAELVDAAVQLYLKVGYENATIEQIASAVDVSPRTFSRYFASKEAVFLAVLDPITDDIIAAVRDQPDHVGPMEALRAGHLAVFTRIADQPFGRPSADQVTMMLRVVNSSDALNKKAMGYRNRRMGRILAARDGSSPDDRTLELVTTLFNVILASAFGSLVADTDAALLSPRLMVERLDEAFAHFAEFAADLPR